MKAIKINNPKEVTIEDIKKPVRKEGEALLKLLYGGICGSDLGSYKGTFAYFNYPRIPGHEFSAEIVEIDENKYGLKKGMIVTCNPYYNCGECYSCKHGRVNACMHNETMGCQRDGAFQQYISMPLERVIDGKGMDPKTLAAIEPFCISHHGVVHQGKVQEGEKVLVIGAGTIGILAAIIAKAKGANVWISDVSEGKLQLAMNFGLDGIILNTDEDSFITEVSKITEGNGFDMTVEAVGLPSTFISCINACCFGGRMVLIGVGKKNADFDFTLLQKKEMCAMGSRNALTEDFVSLIDLVNKGKVPLDKIITNIYPYEKASEAFRAFSENKGDMLKVLLDFTK